MSDGNAQAGPWFLEPLPWEERKGLLWGFPKTVWLLFRHPFQSFQRSDASTLWGTLLFLLVVGLLYGAVQGVDRLLHYYVFHPEMLKWAVEQFPSYKDALPVFLFLRSVANAMVCTLFFVAPVTVILFVCLKDNSISKLLGKSTLRIAVYCLPTLFLTIGTTTGYQVQAIMGLLILIGGIRAIAPAIRNWAPLVAVSAIFAHHAFWVVWDYLIWGPEAAYQTIYSTLFTLLYPLLSP